MATTVVTSASMKVNRAISGATTVNSNCYAIVTYKFLSISQPANGEGSYVGQPFMTVYFGPGQSIPSFYTLTNIGTTYNRSTGAAQSITASYDTPTGVEFINT